MLETNNLTVNMSRKGVVMIMSALKASLPC